MTPPVIIAGFHRSGTSRLAQQLHTAGLFLGDDLIGAMPSNPYGHFEDREIVRLHDQLLRDNGLTWQVTQPFIPYISPHRWRSLRDAVERRAALHPFWGFKDPRASLFLSVWRYLVSDVRVVILFRHPTDSIYSLERRHARELMAGEGPVHLHRAIFNTPDIGLKMWLAYNQHLLSYAEKYRDSTLCIPFDELGNGFPIVRYLRRRWQLPLTVKSTPSGFDPSVTTRRPYRQIVYDAKLLDEAIAIWQRLTSLAVGPLSARDRNEEWA
jgi:hypothetical protein